MMRRALSGRTGAGERVCAAVFVIAAFVLPLTASPYEEALQAMDDNLPQVAAYKLEGCLASAKSDAEKIRCGTALGRALLECGRPGRAVEVLGGLPKSANDEVHFWLARALFAAGDTKGALAEFAPIVANEESSWNGPARVGEAACLRREGRRDEALAALTPLPSGSGARNPACLLAAEILVAGKRPEEARKVLDQIESPTDAQSDLGDYLRAHANLELGREQDAAEEFQRLARQTGAVDPRLAVASVQWGAEALLRAGKMEAAEKFLESFIQDNARSPGLAQVFEMLDGVYGRQEEPSLTEIKKWAGEEQGERAVLAAFYRARLELRTGSQERAEEFYRGFLRNHPTHAYSSLARLELARLLLERGEPAHAEEILGENVGNAPAPPPPVAARLAFARGEALAALGRYPEASVMFQLAARDETLKEAAAENAELTALRSGNPGSAPVLKPVSDSLATAMELARLRNPLAEEALLGIAANGLPVDAQRAQVALAEREWERGNRDKARDRLLMRVANIGTSPEADERADFLALMLADDGEPGADERVAACVQEYLSRHPDAPREGEARFKLGEVLFRKGDYRSSRMQFVEAARLSRDDGLRQQALFLAGLSAARGVSPGSLTQAIEHFEAVAALNGSLVAEARLEEAVVKNALGEPADALIIIDRAIAADADGRIRWRALSEKGDTLLSMAGNDPEKLKAAAGVFQSLAGDPGAPLRWRNEGFCKLGIVLSKMGNRDGALAAYYDVLNGPQNGVPEFFWYYKAGFEAGQMLEDQRLWKEAIGVYEKMAKLQGPRSEEAQARINRLRLENFLWEE